MEERGEITRGGEAQAGDERIRRRIREFVECALLERCPGGQQPNRAVADVLPVSRRGWMSGASV